MDVITAVDKHVSEKWQPSKETLKERFGYLFNNERLADFHFIVGENKLRIPAHKLVLATASDVFETMFFGSLPLDSDEIELPDVEPQSFLAFLEFIYSEEAKIDNETVMATIYVANKYNVPALKKYCVKFLKDHLNCENAVLLLKQATFFEEPDLAESCSNFIDKNTTDILAVENLDLDTLMTVLERDTLQINESKLYAAVLQWAETECARMKLPLTPENQRLVLGPAFKLIRFPLMKFEEFGIGPVQSGLLTDREVRQLILYLTITPKPPIEFSDVPRVGEKHKLSEISWIKARDGQLPPNAVEGGYDEGRPLYVARAYHARSLTPGKFLPSHGVTYIAWGGHEHNKRKYEVLCNCDCSWVSASNGEVPEGALPGGHSEDGETLYIGRVAYPENCLSIGKVQSSHGVMYLSNSGVEMPFREYEVLVVV